MSEHAVKAAREASRSNDPASGLAAVVHLRREVEALEVEQVRVALAAGWSWRRIAESLGVSKQAAHRKHAARPPGGPLPPTDGRRLVITGPARRAVEHARDEARSLGHPAVEPQHLLLGLLRLGGPAAAALHSAGVDLERAQAEVRPTVAPSEDAERSRRDRTPVAPATRASFEQSLREAVARRDDRLGPEHVLLALIRDRDGRAAAVLGRLGVPAGRLQRLLERALAEARARGGESDR